MSKINENNLFINKWNDKDIDILIQKLNHKL